MKTTTTTTTSLLLLAPVLGCLVACGGGGGRAPAAGDADLLAAENVAAGRRANQPQIPRGAAVRLVAPHPSARAAVAVSFGALPREQDAQVPHGTTATVLMEGGKDRGDQVGVEFTSGPYRGRAGWAYRGDLERVGEK